MRSCANANWRVRRTRVGIAVNRLSYRPARRTRTRRDIEYTKNAIATSTSTPKTTRPGNPKTRRSVGSGGGVMRSVRENPEEPRNAVHAAVRVGALEALLPAVGHGGQVHVFSTGIDITEKPMMV